MIDFERFELKGSVHFLGVFKKGTYQISLQNFLDANSFTAYRNYLSKNQGLQLVDIEITTGSGEVKPLPVKDRVRP